MLIGAADLRGGKRSLSNRSRIGRYLRRELNLTVDSYWEFLNQFIDLLCSQGLLMKYRDRNEEYVQLEAASIIWQLGDGTPPFPDPIYSRRVESPVYVEVQRKVNAFYRDAARFLKRIEGREHTAQISYEEHQKREERFREGKLNCLFCSPTMKLGIDIADLRVVHMRNVHPTPANYAQRSGRAGRRGDPALVLTCCAARSAHDQYFFRNREEAFTGVVRSPRLDLGNEDLVRAHIHAIWLAKTGLDLAPAEVITQDKSADGNIVEQEAFKRGMELAAHPEDACVIALALQAGAKICSLDSDFFLEKVKPPLGLYGWAMLFGTYLLGTCSTRTRAQ